MAALDDALDAALAVPPKQLPAVVAALIDLSRKVGRALALSSSLPPVLGIAAMMRFDRDRSNVESLLVAPTSRELRIASLLVAAPALDASDWERVEPRMLAAAMPLVPVDFARAAIETTFANELDLAEILASAAPFVEGPSLDLARQRSIELGDLELQRAAVHALDTSEPPQEFLKALGANANWFPGLEWWVNTDTTERVASVERAIGGDASSEAKLGEAIDKALQKLGKLGGWTHAKPPIIVARDTSDLMRGHKPRVDAQQRPPRVSLGFAAHDAAGQPLERALIPDTAYWLWFEIAPEDVPGAIRGGERSLPRLAADAELDVVLFDYTGQLAIDESLRRGVVRVVERRSQVVTAAGRPDGTDTSARLFFPIRTPTKAGKHAIRVCIYHRGCLLQSLVISALVGDSAGEQRPFSLVTDYSLTKRFDVGAFARADLPHQ